MKLSFKQMMSFVLLCASALSLSCSKQDFSLPSDCTEQSQNSSEERGVTRLAFYSRSTLDKAILKFSGDFYACGYYNGAWRGYRLYW